MRGRRKRRRGRKRRQRRRRGEEEKEEIIKLRADTYMTATYTQTVSQGQVCQTV
jgi:hypothetical protein